MYNYFDMKREMCMVLTFGVGISFTDCLLLTICKPISYNWYNFSNQLAEYLLKIEQLNKSHSSHSFHTQS